MPAECAIAILGGVVVDGTGAPGVRADVAIVDDRISALGDLGDTRADLTIDASDKVVAPGFIDAHTHDDRALLSMRDMAPKVSQGVTTVVAGNCGISLSPLILEDRPPPPLDLLGLAEWYRFPTFAAYRDALDKAPPALNAALLVGHSTLRLGAMDDVTRPANAAEIETMRQRIGESMAAGAIGLSTGLDYPPSAAAPTAEVTALAEAAGAMGGLYATHMRDHAEHAREAINEAVEIGRGANLPVVISHYHCRDRNDPELCARSLTWFEDAKLRHPVAIDAYPYTAGSSSIIPEFCVEGEPVLIAWSESHPDQAGRYIADIAETWGVDVPEAARRLQPGGGIYFGNVEEDVCRLMSHPDCMIGSDGLPLLPHPHPRLWGTFPRVLGRYVRELGLVGLEEAVRRMASLPARTFGLADRGVVRQGAAADLVIFDPATVVDRATYEDPEQQSAGIDTVIVNGGVAWRHGADTGERRGRVLRREADGSDASRIDLAN